MANKQIIDYIREAEIQSLKKAEIIHNLTEAGWDDADIKDALAYINLYPSRITVNKTEVMTQSRAITRERGIALVSIVLGHLWLLSGLNKIFGTQFVSEFAGFVRNQIENGQASNFVKNILSNFVLPNASLMAQLIQYSEFVIGVAFIIGGIWNLIQNNKFVIFCLCLASVGSVLMILSFIMSLGMPFPWIDPANAFAEGVSLEYLVLFLSIAASWAYFHEL